MLSPRHLRLTQVNLMDQSDIRNELGIFPHNVSSCSPLIIGDKIVMATSNGVDWSHLNIPAPLAPALVMVDKNTGKVIAEEASGVSKRALHASWGSAAYTWRRAGPTWPDTTSTGTGPVARTAATTVARPGREMSPRSGLGWRSPTPT